MTIRLASILLAIVVAFASSPYALAQNQSGGTVNTTGNQSGGTVNVSNPPSGSSGTNATLMNPLKAGTSLEQLLMDILAFIIRIGTIVVIFMVVYVGYMFVVAQGKPEEIKKARTALLWTVIGALILLGAQAIATGIKETVQAISGP